LRAGPIRLPSQQPLLRLVIEATDGPEQMCFCRVQVWALCVLIPAGWRFAASGVKASGSGLAMVGPQLVLERRCVLGVS
jgi:hypothetical protein